MKVDNIIHKEKPNALKMLRVPSPVLDVENNQLVCKDRLENNQNETSEIHHKTKKCDNLSFSISSILQACTQRPNTIITDGSNIKHERRIERFDNNTFYLLSKLQ